AGLSPERSERPLYRTLVLLANTFRLLGFTLGAALHAFLAVLLARKRSAPLALMAVAFAGVWHAANAIAMFHRAAAGQENVLLLAILAQAAKIALAILPAPLLDQAAIWSGITRWYAAPLYLVIPLVVWWTNAYSAWVGVGLAAAAGLCLYAQR